MIEKYQVLVSELLKATTDGKINWEPTSTTGEFKVTLGNNAVSIYQHKSIANFICAPTTMDQETYVTLSIWDKDGNVIDDVWSVKGETDADYRTLYELFEAVRRSCNHVDEAIDVILSKLQ